MIRADLRGIDACPAAEIRSRRQLRIPGQSGSNAQRRIPSYTVAVRDNNLGVSVIVLLENVPAEVLAESPLALNPASPVSSASSGCFSPSSSLIAACTSVAAIAPAGVLSTWSAS